MPAAKTAPAGRQRRRLPRRPVATTARAPRETSSSEIEPGRGTLRSDARGILQSCRHSTLPAAKTAPAGRQRRRLPRRPVAATARAPRETSSSEIEPGRGTLAGATSAYLSSQRPGPTPPPKSVDAGSTDRRGTYVKSDAPDVQRSLPKDKNGIMQPDSEYPHTQLGRSTPSHGSEPQARQWGFDEQGRLIPQLDIDFTNHGTPSIHPDLHVHTLTPVNPKNPLGGGFIRSKPPNIYPLE